MRAEKTGHWWELTFGKPVPPIFPRVVRVNLERLPLSPRDPRWLYEFDGHDYGSLQVGYYGDESRVRRVLVASARVTSEGTAWRWLAAQQRGYVSKAQVTDHDVCRLGHRHERQGKARLLCLR